MQAGSNPFYRCFSSLARAYYEANLPAFCALGVPAMQLDMIDLKFLQSKPYKKWYIICAKENTNVNKKIGSIYLSKTNEIGIFIKKEFQGDNIGKFALDEIIKKTKQKRYLANVNPKNKKSIRFFKNNGFKLVQYTFEKN